MTPFLYGPTGAPAAIQSASCDPILLFVAQTLLCPTVTNNQFVPGLYTVSWSAFPTSYDSAAGTYSQVDTTLTAYLGSDLT